ncbi:MAG: GNAT family N-acetyltransferase [Desulforhabdus sp.]|jgi:L-amino acid N-acyltransferase YncA|nr:GNAT family N-acetyltransferase [Desulforhabdus sp.]
MENVAAKLEYPPKRSILINGDIVIFKLLEKSDEAAFRIFFSQVPDHEADTLRHQVRDPKVVARWIENLDYRKVLPLVSWDEALEQIVGVSSLHLMQGVYRHIADVRIFISKGYRRLGLGSAMIKELIEIGNRLGLYSLRAEILSENQLAIKAFRQLGFEVKCTLEGGFMTLQKSETRDVVLMTKRLQINLEEDFFYVF